jgi:Uma2 family endonuclease
MTETSPSDDPDFSAPMAATERITVDEYRRRAASGEFSTSKAFELLEGIVVPKARQTLKHETALENIQNLIGKMTPGGWHLRVQQPIDCGESRPEPDAAIARDALDMYENRLPTFNDVALVIEVADASLALDRRLKGRIYARAGIIVYWLLDLVDNQLEVYTGASGPVPMPGFGERRIYRVEDKLSLVVGLDDLGMVKVRDLLP